MKLIIACRLARLSAFVPNLNVLTHGALYNFTQPATSKCESRESNGNYSVEQLSAEICE